MSNTTLDRLQEEVFVQLTTWSATLTRGIKAAAETTIKEMVAETKQRPRGKYTSGAYAKSIASQIGESTITRESQIWYVKKPNYALTHLLNNGHSLRNGRRYAGDRHVAIAAEHAIAKFEDRVEEVIRNASY